ncbi:MAG: autotransporter-associated beta strand repeat-containing protein, partial [Phycisphaerae bacterium]|nr:autotransporter-associated beta strand repeat-containing protein [Phycisphaerae bacterium]
GGTPAANVQVGFDFSSNDVTTQSNVILSGTSTYAGGTTLAAGTLGINGNSLVVQPGNSLIHSPVGVGTLTIGIGTLAPSHEPTLVAVGAPRTIFNPVEVTRNFNVSGAHRLTFSGTLDLNDAARVITVDSALTINGLLAGNASSALVKHGPGDLTLASSNTFPGSIVVGEGSMAINASQNLAGIFHVGPQARAILGPGSIAVPPGRNVLKAASVTVDSGNSGQLDLGDGGLIVDYTGPTPLSYVTSLIATGYNASAWTGSGIASSRAAAETNTGIGVIEASDVGVGSFLGLSFVGDAVLARYTLYGDNNLDGMVELADFARLAAAFNAPGRWFHGDYDYSGVVDLSDFSRLAANFNQTLPSPLPRTAVPEPAASVALLAAWWLGQRRKVNRNIHRPAERTGISVRLNDADRLE